MAVVFDGARADEQPRADLGVGQAVACESRDLGLLAGESSRVSTGRPAVGKSALLEYAIDSGADLHVAHAVGVESEMELAAARTHRGHRRGQRLLGRPYTK
jgi:hypothetical protein